MVGYAEAAASAPQAAKPAPPPKPPPPPKTTREAGAAAQSPSRRRRRRPAAGAADRAARRRRTSSPSSPRPATSSRSTAPPRRRDSFGAPRTTTWHHGVDIFAPLGAPILAVADGTLFRVGWNDVGGNRLWLRDGAGNEFYYAHLSAYSPLAQEGAQVKAGDVIGFVGTTGDAAGHAAAPPLRDPPARAALDGLRRGDRPVSLPDCLAPPRRPRLRLVDARPAARLPRPAPSSSRPTTSRPSRASATTRSRRT